MKRKDDMEIRETLQGIEELMTMLKQSPESAFYVGKMMQERVRSVQEEVFGSPEIKNAVFQKWMEKFSETTDAGKEVDMLSVELADWRSFIEKILMRRKQQRNVLDEAFCAMMDRICYVDTRVIVRQVIERISSYQPDYVQQLNGHYERLGYMWGNLNVQAGVYDVVENRVNIMAEHWEEMESLYWRLADYRSKNVLYHTLSSWLTYDFADIDAMYENNYPAYWDLDLIQCGGEDVFVDLGAYTGDSVQSYIDTYGVWKKIYAYEMMENNYRQMQNNLNGYKNIILKKKGIGESCGILYVDDTTTGFCDANRLVETGSRKVEVTTLDEDIPERITVIKLDIEGAEQKALLGAKRHIVEEKPKLLVSVYHNNEDIWKIPEILLKMRDDYRLYLRSNGRQYGPVDMVLFAV